MNTNEDLSTALGVLITALIVAAIFFFHWFTEDYLPRRAQRKYIQELAKAINEEKLNERRD